MNFLKKFIKNVKKISLVTSAVSFVAGLLFLIFPAQSIKYLSLAFGIGLIAAGIAGVVSYLKDSDEKVALILGIISVVFGIIVCARYRAIISLILVLFGIYMLVYGIANFITGLKAFALTHFGGITTMVLSVVSAVFGFVAVFRSHQLTETIVQLIGIAMIIYAVLSVISYFQVKSMFDKTEAQLKDAIDVEGEIIDEKDE